MKIPEWMLRSAALIGREGMERLISARVLVLGAGGVGGALCESLARSGISNLAIVDNDTISPSNINRQIYSLHSSIGRLKIEVAKERILDINPCCNVTLYNMFYEAESADKLNFSEFDYIADAIDTVSAKIIVAVKAKEAGVPLISSMGTGNKLDPSLLELADISKTDTCPLARVMRRELRARGIEELDVVFSREPPKKPDPTFYCEAIDASTRRLPPGTLPFVPNAAGILMASTIVRNILK